MAVLKIIKGSAPGQVLELRGDRMLFGRHPNCQIVLDDAAVSRHHAQILENHGNFYLEDLRSRNGTFLNGVSIEGRAELHDADEIQVCNIVFRFHESFPPVEEADTDPLTRPAGQAAKRKGAPSKKQNREGRSFKLGETIDSESDNSSIITTLDANVTNNLRLNVKPEVKLRAVLEISQSLGKLLNLEQVLPNILDSLFKIFPQADEGFVLLRDDKTGKLALKATKTRDNRPDDAVPVSMTVVSKAMRTREAILSANAADDQRFTASESLVDLQIRSMMCVPLEGESGESVGVIQISTRDISRQFSQEDLDVLVAVASQASLAIKNAELHENLLHQKALEQELEFATQVQLGFLPNKRPKVDSYEFFDFYEAAYRVGGDYFDYVTLPDKRIGVALGDVAGKGVPAALLMARLYSASRYHLLTATSVAEALSGLNSEIASSGLGHRFITVIAAVLDSQTHEIRIANAGHLPPLLRSASGKVSLVAREISCLPLGIKPDQEYLEATLTLEPGDTLLFYTDGVTEAMNSAREIYHTRRLVDFVETGPKEIEPLIRGIVADVEKFCNEVAQRDDMCLVGLRRIE